MSGTWGGGYVTDIAYMSGYYGMQSPLHLAVSCLMAGYDADRPDPDTGLVYLELGSGLGLGAMVLAAANPGWRIFAVDFHPAHIAQAQRAAADCGLTNVTFLEADLSTLAGSAAAAAIPQADVVSMHGVWSWVSAEVKAGIVRLLREKVLPGGVVHVSYNTLPAWQGELGVQRVLREAGLRLAGRSDRQVLKGLELARELMAAEAHNIKSFPRAAGLLDQLVGRPPEYLAHEFMNGNWMPCFHADVAAALSEAKLEWVASAHLAENFPELTLTEKQREIHARFEDSTMQELVKDMCLNRGLRHDVFVRGARRIDQGSRTAALESLVLMLTLPPEEFVYEFDMPAGRAKLNEEFYRPIVQALGEGPRRVGDLLGLPELRAGSRNAAELVAVMISMDQAVLVSSPGSGAGERARALNGFTGRRLLAEGSLTRGGAAASKRLGGGLNCSAGELYLLDRIAAAGGLMDPAIYAGELIPNAPEEERIKVRDLFARLIERRGAVWRAAGLP